MNDTSVHDLVSRSLDRHASAVGAPVGDLTEVLRRVERRRTRRRGAAVVGSVLAVGLGAAGVVLVAGPAVEPAVGDGDPAASDPAASWGCTGLLSWDGTADYWESCEPFPEVVRPAAPVLPPATTAAVPTTTTSGVVGATAPGPDVRHVVVAGDSVSVLADRYGVSPDVLVALNGWTEGIEHPLLIGDVIAVPGPAATLPHVTTAASAPVASAPVCESSVDGAPLTVACDAPVPSTAAPAATVTTSTATTTPMALPATTATAFRCTGPLGGDLAYSYYLSCERVRWDAVPTAVVPTTITFTAVVAPTAPLRTVPPGTAPPLSGDEQLHTVVPGDTLTAIAGLYGVDLDVLVSYNAWPDGVDHLLLVGDIVKIPPGSRIP